MKKLAVGLVVLNLSFGAFADGEKIRSGDLDVKVYSTPSGFHNVYVFEVEGKKCISIQAGMQCFDIGPAKAEDDRFGGFK